MGEIGRGLQDARGGDLFGSRTLKTRCRTEGKRMKQPRSRFKSERRKGDVVEKPLSSEEKGKGVDDIP